ncbi:MAG: diheme cytochrome c [Gammaproteobacteria bacterium]|nr:diheme cytochrome c [Gammaproteobacteria bacterium]MCW8957670.1 diheme cytochrome c [Gammaproteobacteria bacterium]MCW8971721.1 diheme cytochrome c [Gammaproteobacteria bacterium]MCW8993374.1 diheme cytochrome c [Gammaproteobacteria bacterium]
MKLKAIPLTALAVCILGANSVLADDDWGWSRRAPDVAPVKNELYQSECGSCHFAYQPGLLPAASWEKLMGGLADHFGENAELFEDTRKTLTVYLVTNAADNVDGYRRSAKILRSLNGERPLRITETPYIRYKHNEIPPRVIRNNKDVRSLSNCAACHTRADTGSYAEREIDIPGIGRWEDD